MCVRVCFDGFLVVFGLFFVIFVVVILFFLLFAFVVFCCLFFFVGWLWPLAGWMFLWKFEVPV